MDVACLYFLLFGLLWSFSIPCTFGFFWSFSTDAQTVQSVNCIRPCYLFSDTKSNWTEAHNYCHTNQGYLLNSISPNPLNYSVIHMEQLIKTSDYTIWSGLHVRKYRLVEDNFPLPNRIGEFGGCEWRLNFGEECVQMYPRPKSRSLKCPSSHEKNFTTCERKLNFICVFEALTSSSEASQQPQIQVSSNNLTVEDMKNGEYLLNRKEKFEGQNLTISCVVPTTGQLNTQLQSPVIYKLGTPLASTRGNDSSQNYWTATDPVSRNFAQLYRCEVFDPSSNTILESLPALVRFRDDIVISAQIELVKKDELDYALQALSLVGNFSSTFQQNVSNIMSLFWRPIEDSKKKIIPVIFLNGTNVKHAKLVVLFLKNSINFDNLGQPTTTIEDVQTELNKTVQKLQVNMTALNMSSLKSYQLHPCSTSGKDQFNLLNKKCSLDKQQMFSSFCERDILTGAVVRLTHVKTDCDCSQFTGISKQLWCSVKDNSTSMANYSFVIQEIKTIAEARTESLEANNVSIFADILNRSSHFRTLPESTIQNTIDVIDSINRLPIATLKQAQEESNATQKIIERLEHLGSQVELPDGHNRLVSKSMALEVWNLTHGEHLSPIIGFKIKNTFSNDLRNEDVGAIKSDNEDLDSAISSISLQEEFVRSLTTNKPRRPEIKLTMTAHTNPNIFEVSSPMTSDNQTSSQNNIRYRIKSFVMSMHVFVNNVQWTNLTPYHVTIRFAPFGEIPNKEKIINNTCVYWNLVANQGTGDWATDGCYYKTEKGQDVCTCNHLTNFAVIMSFYDQDVVNDEHDAVLRIVSIVGLSLSIFGLSLSIVSFLLIKSLRNSLPQKMLFQYSLSLLFSWIVFLAGFKQTSSETGCLVVAALFHYLILSSFMWMLGQGILQHMMIVQVMKAVSPKFIVIYSLIAWGFPIIPVGIVLAIDIQLYKGGNIYCWMKPTALYYSVALPVGLIVITNIIIFIQIVHRLHKRSEIGRRATLQGNQTLINVRASILSFCILGLSWTFAFFAIAEARVYFQYLFCILVSLQGFFIFAMMIARNHRFQQYWKSVFSCCFRASGDSTTSDSQQKFIGGKQHRLKSEPSNNSAQTYRTEIRSDTQDPEDETSH